MLSTEDNNYNGIVRVMLSTENKIYIVFIASIVCSIYGMVMLSTEDRNYNSIVRVIKMAFRCHWPTV